MDDGDAETRRVCPYEGRRIDRCGIIGDNEKTRGVAMSKSVAFHQFFDRMTGAINVVLFNEFIENLPKVMTIDGARRLIYKIGLF